MSPAPMTKYAIVPVELSEEMANSGRIVIGEDAEMNPAHLQDGEVREVWAAILAASPPSGMVAVRRGLLESILKYADPDPDQEAELRALLSQTATGEGLGRATNERA